MELNDIKIIPLLDTLRLQKISDEVYFSEKYRNYVSNSRLGLINPQQDGSPEKFFEGFKMGYSSSLEIGSAVHELVLQPDLFVLQENTQKPTAKLGAMADRLYPVYDKTGKVTKEDVIDASEKVDYYVGKITDNRYSEIIEKCTPYWEYRKSLDSSETRDRIFLDHKSTEIVKSCVESLAKNNNVENLLHPKGIVDDPISENEQAILLDVKVICPNGKEFVLRLKSKLDNYTIDKETNTITVNDVKTISKYVNEIEGNIERFHYNRELAMYLYLLKLCAVKFYGMTDPKMKANYLVVSTVPDFYSKVRPVSNRELRYGFFEFAKLLKYVAYQIGYNNYSF